MTIDRSEYQASTSKQRINTRRRAM